MGDERRDWTARAEDLILFINLKFRAIQNYELYGSNLFRKPYKTHAARYIPRLTKIFTIVANTHSAIPHRRTQDVGDRGEALLWHN